MGKKEKRISLPWFHDLLLVAFEKAGKSHSTLAKQLGVSRQTIMAWEGTSLPRIDHFVVLVNYLGGDISRALPNYDPIADARIIDKEQRRRLKVRIHQLESAIADARFALDQIDNRLDHVVQIAADSNGEDHIVGDVGL